MFKREKVISKIIGILVALAVLTALSGFATAFAEDSTSSNYYLEKANKLFIKSHFDEALENYNKAIDLDPTNVNAYRGKAMSLMARSPRDSHFYQSVETLDKLIELDPDNAAIYYIFKGGALKMLGRDYEAKYAFDKANEIDPEAYKKSFPNFFK